MAAKSDAARERNNALSLEIYYWYKERGICPRCGCGIAEPGRVYCARCYQRIRNQKDRRDPGCVKRKAYSRERRERLKAAGLCVDCGKARAVEGRIRCQRCEERMKESRKKWEILHAMDMEAEEARKRNG
jgi:hypothetical protein